MSDIPDPERGPLHLPKGYRVVIDGESVSFFREGFVNEDAEGEGGQELIYASDMLHFRRPSVWEATNLSDTDKKVLQDALWNGWGYRCSL